MIVSVRLEQTSRGEAVFALDSAVTLCHWLRSERLMGREDLPLPSLTEDQLTRMQNTLLAIANSMQQATARRV